MEGNQPTYYAIDNMVLVWLLREGTTDRDIEMRERTSVLFRKIEELNVRVIVPTVVVSEFLVRVPSAQHGQAISVLQQQFFVAPFDARASSLAAQLWQQHRALPVEEQVQRSILKADVLVVATAKSAGASVFYSNDAGSRKIAQLARMEPRDLPSFDEHLPYE